MPPLTLSDAVTLSSERAASSGEAVDKISWLECFTGNGRVTEFSAATDPSGNLESNSSSGQKEYQDRLRVIALRQEGMEKATIAEAVGRPAKFVQTWWRKEPKEVPKPLGVHEYLKTEFWRDIEIVRGFGKGLGIYEDALSSTEWVQPMADGREFKNGGGYRLKYDKEGRMRPQGNQNAKDGVVLGRLPKLDALAQRLLVEQGIDDRVLQRPGLLWYPDGNADAIVHRHEAWTALMSFGAPRILTIDNHPVLLRDGDLIVFGTQRHGVPKMCNEGSTFDEYGGRMSVVFFFMPTEQQASGSAPWRTINGGELSRKMTAVLRDADLGKGAQISGLLTGSKSAEVQQLIDLGFEAAQAAAALKATSFDVALAAEALLNGSGPALLLDVGGGGCGYGRSAQLLALYARLTELHNCRSMSCSGSHTSVACEDDQSMARRLQVEDGQEASHGSGVDWEERAILEQVQELERVQDSDGLTDPSALAAQFAQYDEMLDDKDAEEWDGRGDLMVREWRRQRLHIEQQDHATLYGFGCGMQREKVFFELLSLHSIRVLYDFRVDAERVGLSHFKPTFLESACKRHAVHYRYAPLGREGAYGILKHLKEDEGRNLLAELVWHARRKRTAFLGVEEDWCKDHRLAIAARLREAGHSVLHVAAGGGVEEHPEQIELPDFLVGEEARLRSLEKQRASGEVRRPEKSAESRSTESIAQRLTRPQQEIDVGAELRKANTQAELCRAQRRLADLQRKSEGSDAKAGLGPKLLNVTKWVKAEAALQKENLAAGKTKDGKEKSEDTTGGPAPAYAWTGSGGTSGGNPDFSSAARSSAPAARITAAGSSGVAALSIEHACGEPPLIVECLGCSSLLSWSVLSPGDGRCPRCLTATTAPTAPTAAAATAAAADDTASAAASATLIAAASAVAGAAAAPSAAPSPAQGEEARSSWRARRAQERGK